MGHDQNDLESCISSLTPAEMIRSIRASEWFGLLSHGILHSDTRAGQGAPHWMVTVMHRRAPQGELKSLRSGELLEALPSPLGPFRVEVEGVFPDSHQAFIHVRRPDGQTPRIYRLGPGDYFWLHRDTGKATVSPIGPLMVTTKISDRALCGPTLSVAPDNPLDAVWASIPSPLNGWDMDI